MTANIAHPQAKAISLCDGTVTARIPKWTMAKRADVKPRIVGLLEQVGNKAGDGTVVTGIADLFAVGEEELVQICKVCVELPDGVSFDDLLWEDLPIMVQAIWETNVQTDEGGGIGGKALSLFMPLMLKGAQELQAEQARKANQHQTSSQRADSPPLRPSVLNSPASPSSPDAGEPAPTS